jgi:signal transduction histidine kinase
MRAQEIKKLVTLINQRLDRSRNAIGNLAHALKNPLTILFRLAEDPSLSGNDRVRETLVTNTNIMLKIVEGELRRARVAGIGPAAHCFNPKVEVNALVKVIRSMYHDRDLAFEVHVPDIDLHHDRHDLMELLGNLVDNAAKWSRHRIDITMSFINADLLIIVEDDGEGCDESTMMELLQRGARLDESRGGHGLGLSIVKSLVEQHGGSIQFSKSSHLGGLKVITKLKESEYPLKD